MPGYSPAANVWVSWNATYTTTNCTTNAETWVAWNQCAYQQSATIMGNTNHVAFREPTLEEIEIATANAENARKDAEAAKVRAKALLLEHLDPHQREMYQKERMFIVETPKKRRYALYHDHQVHRLDGERRVERYCIHTYGVPREDELLGFKLLLEADEDQFLKTANATRLAA